MLCPRDRGKSDCRASHRAKYCRNGSQYILCQPPSRPFAISLPAVSKHLRVLEAAGLIARDIDGRVHRCSLRLDTVAAAEQWLASRRAFWEGTLDALARHVAKDKRARNA
jgi:DNA-binding transcriptional ArsR family regulator